MGSSVSTILTSRLILNLRRTVHRTLGTIPSNWSQSMEFGGAIVRHAELSINLGESASHPTTPIVRDPRELQCSPRAPDLEGDASEYRHELLVSPGCDIYAN